MFHPLRHSIEIFSYVFVVNVALGVVMYYVGEDKLVAFLGQNKYLAPLLSVVVGAIPNCVSSVVLSELYIMGGLGFGATLGGLCMNAGLGFVYLFKDVKHTKTQRCDFLCDVSYKRCGGVRVLRDILLRRFALLIEYSPPYCVFPD